MKTSTSAGTKMGKRESRRNKEKKRKERNKRNESSPTVQKRPTRSTACSGVLARYHGEGGDFSKTESMQKECSSHWIKACPTAPQISWADQDPRPIRYYQDSCGRSPFVYDKGRYAHSFNDYWLPVLLRTSNGLDDCQSNNRTPNQEGAAGDS